jgi:DNA primase small subunit
MSKRVLFRAATLGEREEYYENEFSLKSVKEWFSDRPLPQLCAVDAGSETGIIVNKKYKGRMFYFPFSQLMRKIKKYVPEDVYYDRSTYADPVKALNNLKSRDYVSQELAFDIDADNLSCRLPKGQSGSDLCINKAFAWTVKMKRELEMEFAKVRVVYSGRGFHLHVLDERAFNLAVAGREKLNKKYSRYPIDPWVSRGYIRLIRMPYSLHGMVSRIVTPVDVAKGFDRNAVIPRFLA